MRACSITAVLVALACPWAATGQAGGGADAAVREVRAAVMAFGEAYAAADVDALRDRLTDGYIHVNGGSGSIVTREAWLAWVAGRREALEAGTLVVDRYDVSDLEVRVHGGDAAVATGVVTASGRRDGEPFRTRIRFTNLWVRTPEGWKRAAFHDSPVEPSAG